MKAANGGGPSQTPPTLTRLNIGVSPSEGAIYRFFRNPVFTDLPLRVFPIFGQTTLLQKQRAESGLARRVKKANPPQNAAGSGEIDDSRSARTPTAYFCHVRFLWRFAFKRFRRLCLFIFRRRFFFRLPMVI